jgi:aspartate 1-decarboxylase
MARIFLRSKIHNAVVTEARKDYVGSFTIDRALMDKADLAEDEKVLVVDVTNGHRLETYLIPGEAGSGVVCANGAAAHLIHKGDTVIVMSFDVTDKPRPPRVIVVDTKNRFAGFLKEKALQPSPRFPAARRARR